ncbi:hypothetical protein OAK75_10855 [Bacteriovoracales bacterium]|nr:hypothetical protein [Bacteriovoracales bacterium]
MPKYMNFIILIFMNILKKIGVAVLLVCFFSCSSSLHAQARSGAKAKALGSMAMYGTIGGALLGTASLAFGTTARAIAQGASLGLYAGLIFGSYVVLSHRFQRDWDDYDYGIQRPPMVPRTELVAMGLKNKKRPKEWNIFVPLLSMTY